MIKATFHLCKQEENTRTFQGAADVGKENQKEFSNPVVSDEQTNLLTLV